MSEHVLEENPATSIRAEKVHAPLPDLLFDEEVDRLLKISSENPRTYLLILLFLETGMKKAEVADLQVGDFDSSNKYQPEVWIKHSGKQLHKDRRLKLPGQLLGCLKTILTSTMPPNCYSHIHHNFYQRSSLKSGVGLISERK